MILHIHIVGLMNYLPSPDKLDDAKVPIELDIS
jgi:hypothetical protein